MQILSSVQKSVVETYAGYTDKHPKWIIKVDYQSGFRGFQWFVLVTVKQFCMLRKLRTSLFEKNASPARPGLRGEVNFSYCLYEIFHLICQLQGWEARWSKVSLPWNQNELTNKNEQIISIQLTIPVVFRFYGKVSPHLWWGGISLRALLHMHLWAPFRGFLKARNLACSYP